MWPNRFAQGVGEAGFGTWRRLQLGCQQWYLGDYFACSFRTSIGADAAVEPDSDPTAPEMLMVSAILHGGRRPAIMIGQRVYYEQDQVDDHWRILAIHPDRVTVAGIDDAP